MLPTHLSATVPVSLSLSASRPLYSASEPLYLPASQPLYPAPLSNPYRYRALSAAPFASQPLSFAIFDTQIQLFSVEREVRWQKY